ncbi:MAG: MerR family transcriptional regulator [Planctomycetes bacterium]|nr:MerR family transcriptional regulator [Planctomycetota bacterium]
MKEVFKYYPKKLYRISEILHYLKQGGTELSRQTIHNYTMMGLISESSRLSGGHRLYDENVFSRLRKIELLKRHRTLSEVKKILNKEK